jgi:hypothetical protein
MNGSSNGKRFKFPPALSGLDKGFLVKRLIVQYGVISS